MSIFDQESKFVRGLNLFTDLFIVNILTEIGLSPFFAALLILSGSIKAEPLVTAFSLLGIFAGVPYTALHYCVSRLARGEEGYAFKSFFKACKENFKQSLIIGAVFFLIFGVLILDIGILKANGFIIPAVVCFFALLLAYMAFLYAFALQARYYNPIKQTLKNSILHAILHFPRTVGMMLVHLAVALLLYFFSAYAFFFMIVVGFALIAYVRALIYVKVL